MPRMTSTLALLALLVLPSPGCQRKETPAPEAHRANAVTPVSSSPCSAPSQVARSIMETRLIPVPAAGPAGTQADPTIESAIKETSGLVRVQYVIKDASKWRVGQTLRICFTGGDATTRHRIRETATDWTKYANLSFDFGPEPDLRTCAGGDGAEVRVTFRCQGYNSFVGTDGLAQRNECGGTLNLEDIDVRPPSNVHTVVLHEFGHAIGFEHEHQNPTGGCDQEFDWPTIYAELCRPPNRWSKEVVDFNLRSLPDSMAYPHSTHDPRSIMHYSFDSWMFNKGPASPCYVQEAIGLSPVDIEGARRTYPSNAVAENQKRVAVLEETIRTLPPDKVQAHELFRRALIHLKASQ